VQFVLPTASCAYGPICVISVILSLRVHL
jgi:hypothetical protein